MRIPRARELLGAGLAAVVAAGGLMPAVGDAKPRVVLKAGPAKVVVPLGKGHGNGHGPGHGGPAVVVRGPRLRVRVGPPALRVEVRTGSPSNRHHWVAGHWGWHDGKHVWKAGVWLLPPVAAHVWTPARWVQTGDEWEYEEGAWGPPAAEAAPTPPPASAAAPEAVPAAETASDEADVAPPPPQAEVQTKAPSRKHVWIPGHWSWRGGRHHWVGGHWLARKGGADWVPAHWEARGARWKLVPGHWSR